MNDLVTLEQLAAYINNPTSPKNYPINTQLIKGEIDVLQVLLEEREDFPIYITIDESQILCVSYLWQEQEIIAAKKLELFDTLLTLNIPMPLSSFSKIGHQYIIFGAMSTLSDCRQIVHEIEVLSENTLDALELLTDYLQ